MQLRQIKFPRVTVQTGNKMKYKPNREAAQTNKVSWSHNTENERKIYLTDMQLTKSFLESQHRQ